MDEKQILLSRMDDLARQAEHTGAASSKFLTPGEVQIVRQQYQNRRDISLVLDGGFEGAERQIAVFLNPDWGRYEREDILSLLRLDYRDKDALSHRDILGALMGLGLKREVIGDILCDGPPAYLACLREMAGFVKDNLSKAGRAGVRVTDVSKEETPARTETMKAKTITVASLRLDVLVSAAFSVSRSEAAALITAGRVSVDHLPCENTSKEIGEGAVLSVRGFGRAMLVSIGGKSRKDRIYVEIGLYCKNM